MKHSKGYVLRQRMTTVALRITPVGQRRMRLALMGPAFIAAIGYIDPGNFATNIQAGQVSLPASSGGGLGELDGDADSGAVGQARHCDRENLAEQIRDHYPRPLVWFYWVQAEIIA
jgi:manganese transport protein